METTNSQELQQLNPANLRTAQNFAAQLGKSRATVYNYIKAGRLKQVYLDGMPFVDISTYIEKEPKAEKPVRKSKSKTNS